MNLTEKIYNQPIFVKNGFKLNLIKILSECSLYLMLWKEKNFGNVALMLVFCLIGFELWIIYQILKKISNKAFVPGAMMRLHLLLTKKFLTAFVIPFKSL